MNHSRRKLLVKLVAGGAISAAAPFLIRQALAMGDRLYTQGFHKLQGTVLLNNKPVNQGMLVKPGDTVTTGSNSLAIFVVGRDAFMLRSNSHLELSGIEGAIKTLNLLTGKILSVFDKGEKKMILPTATMGIRGTAIYAEADPVRSYLCTCYGTVVIQSKSNPAVQETVVTKKHDAPRYIYASGEQLIVKAPVGRLPDFFSLTADNTSGY